MKPAPSETFLAIIFNLSLKSFIKTLDIPNDAKKQLLSLTPEKYIGLAKKLVKSFS
jgi:adenylosuccinate lyase